MKNPRFLQTTKTMLATVAITGLMAGSAARLHATTTGTPDQNTSMSKGQLADDSGMSKHDCKGMNSCKGQGGCKTSDNGCKGKNTCKGKGGCKTNGTT
jgi:hypothetical protein